jgi:hypothetical protein
MFEIDDFAILSLARSEETAAFGFSLNRPLNLF